MSIGFSRPASVEALMSFIRESDFPGRNGATILDHTG
jgi:hypothetical protein